MSTRSMQLLRGLAFALTLASVPSVSFAEGQSAPAARVSKRMSDAILADFRKDENTPLSNSERTPVDVDPDVVMLPDMEVREKRIGASMDPSDLALRTEAIPLRFGTGITELRGKKFTVLTKKILFIPVGFKLKW